MVTPADIKAKAESLILISGKYAGSVYGTSARIELTAFVDALIECALASMTVAEKRRCRVGSGSNLTDKAALDSLDDALCRLRQMISQPPPQPATIPPRA